MTFFQNTYIVFGFITGFGCDTIPKGKRRLGTREFVLERPADYCNKEERTRLMRILQHRAANRGIISELRPDEEIVFDKVQKALSAEARMLSFSELVDMTQESPDTLEKFLADHSELVSIRRTIQNRFRFRLPNPPQKLLMKFYEDIEQNYAKGLEGLKGDDEFGTLTAVLTRAIVNSETLPLNAAKEYAQRMAYFYKISKEFEKSLIITDPQPTEVENRLRLLDPQNVRNVRLSFLHQLKEYKQANQDFDLRIVDNMLTTQERDVLNFMVDSDFVRLRATNRVDLGTGTEWRTHYYVLNFQKIIAKATKQGIYLLSTEFSKWFIDKLLSFDVFLQNLRTDMNFDAKAYEDFRRLGLIKEMEFRYGAGKNKIEDTRIIILSKLVENSEQVLEYLISRLGNNKERFKQNLEELLIFDNRFERKDLGFLKPWYAEAALHSLQTESEETKEAKVLLSKFEELHKKTLEDLSRSYMNYVGEIRGLKQVRLTARPKISALIQRFQQGDWEIILPSNTTYSNLTEEENKILSIAHRLANSKRLTSTSLLDNLVWVDKEKRTNVLTSFRKAVGRYLGVKIQIPVHDYAIYETREVYINNIKITLPKERSYKQLSDQQNKLLEILHELADEGLLCKNILREKVETLISGLFAETLKSQLEKLDGRLGIKNDIPNYIKNPADKVVLQYPYNTTILPSKSEYMGLTKWQNKILVKIHKLHEKNELTLPKLISELKTDWYEVDRQLKAIGHALEMRILIPRKIYDKTVIEQKLYTPGDELEETIIEDGENIVPHIYRNVREKNPNFTFEDLRNEALRIGMSANALAVNIYNLRDPELKAKINALRGISPEEDLEEKITEIRAKQSSAAAKYRISDEAAVLNAFHEVYNHTLRLRADYEQLQNASGLPEGKFAAALGKLLDKKVINKENILGKDMYKPFDAKNGENIVYLDDFGKLLKNHPLKSAQNLKALQAAA